MGDCGLWLAREADPANMTTTTTTCEMCKEKASKYTCPQCTTKTCSLECVKRHKAVGKCAGVSKSSEFVPRSRLVGGDETVLRRDFSLLSGAAEQIERSKRWLNADKKRRAVTDHPQNPRRRPSSSSQFKKQKQL